MKRSPGRSAPHQGERSGLRPTTGRSAALSAETPTTATVRLVNGRRVTIPISAGIEIMAELLSSGRPLGEVAGESIEFWARVEPDEEHGSLINDLIQRCRKIVARREAQRQRAS